MMAASPSPTNILALAVSEAVRQQFERLVFTYRVTGVRRPR